MTTYARSDPAGLQGVSLKVNITKYPNYETISHLTLLYGGKMGYNVVFEYDSTLGGLFGTRKFQVFLSKADFEKEIHRYKFVIAKGVSDQEAHDLVALTPEICRYMAAIEDYFNDTINPNSIELYNKLKSIREHVIVSDREVIFTREWDRINAKPFIKYFKVLAERNPSTIKSFAIMWAISAINDIDTGEVL